MAQLTKYTNLFKSKPNEEEEKLNRETTPIRPQETNASGGGNEPSLFNRFKQFFHSTPGESRTVDVPDLMTGKTTQKVIQAEDKPSKFRELANYIAPTLLSSQGGIGPLPGLITGTLANDAMRQGRQSRFDKSVEGAEDQARGNYQARTGRIAATRPSADERQFELAKGLYGRLAKAEAGRPETALPANVPGPRHPQSSLLEKLQPEVSAYKDIFGAKTQPRLTSEENEYQRFQDLDQKIRDNTITPAELDWYESYLAELKEKVAE